MILVKFFFKNIIFFTNKLIPFLQSYMWKFYYWEWSNRISREELTLTIEFMLLNWYSGFRELNFLISDNLDLNFFFNNLNHWCVDTVVDYFWVIYIKFLDYIDNFCFSSFHEFENYYSFFFKIKTDTPDYIDLDLDGRHYLYITNYRNAIRESEKIVPEFTDSP